MIYWQYNSKYYFMFQRIIHLSSMTKRSGNHDYFLICYPSARNDLQTTDETSHHDFTIDSDQEQA